MRLTSEQVGEIEAWMAERQKLFGLARKPKTEAWMEYRCSGGLKISLAQFYRISLQSWCNGVLKFWRGRPMCREKQLLLWPDG